jgi:sugar phosphate isomerase/epimerase
MKTLTLALISCTLLSTLAAVGAEPSAQDRFFAKVGLQLYSLRDQFPKDGFGPTLDRVKSWGVKYVEVSGAGVRGVSPAQYQAELRKRGLVPIGSHFPYDRLKKDIEGVAAEAKALGISYVGCAWIGHKKPFDEKQCREAAEVFNRAGQALARRGLKFYYHNHGYEFLPYGHGTLFDLLAAQTNPKYVSFQLDVLWTILPGVDPAKLLEKYPGRFVFVHLKDLRKGVATGDHSAKTALTNDVRLGTGQVDWPAFIRAAEKTGVKYYFIEDESPTSVEQIPQSLKFLRGLKF